jgi:hypothetical protein
LPATIGSLASGGSPNPKDFGLGDEQILPRAKKILLCLRDGACRVACGCQSHVYLPLQEGSSSLAAYFWRLFQVRPTLVYHPGPPALSAWSTSLPGVWISAEEKEPCSSARWYLEFGPFPVFLGRVLDQKDDGWQSRLPAKKPAWLEGFLTLLAEKVARGEDPGAGHRLDLSPWLASQEELGELMRVIGKGPVFARREKGWDRWLAFSSRWPGLWWVKKQALAGPWEVAFEVGKAPSFVSVGLIELCQSVKRLEELLQGPWERLTLREQCSGQQEAEAV